MDLDPIIQHSAAVEREMRTHAINLEVRLSTWVLAGHGAALLLCFNALSAHHICDWTAIRPLALLFLIGSFMAFASVIFAMWSFARLATRMEKINSLMRNAASDARLVTQLSSVCAENPDNPNVLRTTIENAEKKASEKIAEIGRIAEAPWWDRVLPRFSDCFLALSVFAFAWAVSMAVWSDHLSGALCPLR